MASQPKYSEVIPLRVTAKMYKEIRIAAQREFLTMSHLLRKLIREGLEKK
jgi:hypothetical protein